MPRRSCATNVPTGNAGSKAWRSPCYIALGERDALIRDAEQRTGQAPKDEQPPRLDPHDDREPLNVDIRTETSRPLGIDKADHRGTTKSAVAGAAISEWLAKRNY